ncbi:MAG: SRPBCC family protein [Miltoncostaeaceae bacterium]
MSRDASLSPPAHGFRFLDRWSLPLPPGEAYDLLARPRYYPLWWRGGVVACPSFDPGEPMVGHSATLVVRGFLPYRLTLVSTAVALDPPSRIVAESTGDLVGRGEWTLVPDGDGGTRAEFDWQVEVVKRLERRLAPYLRPLLAANHRWTMRRGEQGMAEHGPAVLGALGERRSMRGRVD